MSKRFLLASIAAAALAASPAHAALIAGWDFSQYVSDGFLSTDAATNSTQLSANNSSLDLTGGGGIESAAFGTLYYDGSFGSTAVAANTQLKPVAPGLNGNVTNGAPDFNVDNSFEGGQITWQDVSLNVASPASLVFSADLTSIPEFGQDWSLAFGGQTFGGTADLAISFSLDGASYTSVGQVTLNTNDLPYSVVLPGAAADKIFVKIDFSGFSGNNTPKIDNVGLYGTTVVPEPGTVVLLLGGLAGLAAVGRRRA